MDERETARQLARNKRLAAQAAAMAGLAPDAHPPEQIGVAMDEVGKVFSNAAAAARMEPDCLRWLTFCAAYWSLLTRDWRWESEEELAAWSAELRPEAAGEG